MHGERLLGWVADYPIGVAFAFLLIGVGGRGWVRTPTLTPALGVGLGTVVAPWFIMQPAMGAGIAGANTPNPVAQRTRNLATTLVYGIGIYLTALTFATLATNRATQRRVEESPDVVTSAHHITT